MTRLQTSFAAFPGMTHSSAAQEAVRRASEQTLTEPGLASVAPGAEVLHLDHVQLVPQSFGWLSMQACEDLMDFMPNTKFRLHANARVMHSHRIADLSNFSDQRDWFEKAARISWMLEAPAYTTHSGRRANATMSQMLDNARRCADLFRCPVGVEGQYPTRSGEFLVDSWAEYREVFESGVPYVLDLSHLNIVAHSSGDRNESLVAEMLANPLCIEVHVSDNDGKGDWHQVCQAPPWWAALLKHVNAEAVVFSEGNQLRQRKSAMSAAANSEGATA